MFSQSKMFLNMYGNERLGGECSYIQKMTGNENMDQTIAKSAY